MEAFIDAGAIAPMTGDALFLQTAGPSFARYVRHILPWISKVAPGADAELVRSLVRGFSEYYRFMARALCDPASYRTTGSAASEKALSDLRREMSGCVILSFQLGAPLLLPRVLAIETQRGVAAYLHRRNALANDFMTLHRPQVAVLDVEGSSAFEAVHHLKQRRHVLANIDTAYVDTRCFDVHILGGRLSVPAGLLDIIPNRAGAPVFGAVLFITDRGLSLELQRLDKPDARNRSVEPETVAEFFEPLIRRAPFQWMGWASLEGAHAED